MHTAVLLYLAAMSLNSSTLHDSRRLLHALPRTHPLALPHTTADLPTVTHCHAHYHTLPPTAAHYRNAAHCHTAGQPHAAAHTARQPHTPAHTAANCVNQRAFAHRTPHTAHRTKSYTAINTSSNNYLF
jgi:hypothetical protein